MAIEKVTLVDVEGSLRKINKTLVKCCESGCFHINPPPNIAGSEIEAKNLKDKGLYERRIKQCRTLADSLGVTLDGKASYDDIEYTTSSDFKEYLSGIDGMQAALTEEKQQINAALRSKSAIYHNLMQFKGFDSDLKELFSCKYAKVRFGRLPNDSIRKLDHYAERDFFFIAFDKKESFTWCLYVTTTAVCNDIDYIFRSLGFERTIIPDYLNGSTEKAAEKLFAEMEQMIARASEIETEIEAIAKSEGAKLSAVYAKLLALHNSYELRTNVLVVDNRFHFSGYVPEKQAKKFRESVTSVGDVSVTVREADTDGSAPVKLKNCWLFRPFEMFVRMYGLPAANGIDPTPIVAITYMFLYGMMFGDVGQGFLVALIGILMTRFTKVPLAPIIARIGFSSMAFGVLYGSVFGSEEIIKPFFHVPQIYEMLGFAEAPKDIFAVSTVLLIAALAVGIVLILMSMLLNIIINIKTKDYEAAVFGGSGALGFIFYAALVAGLVCSMVLGIELMQPWYVVLFIVLPLVIMFFKEPIVENLFSKNGKKASKKRTGAAAKLESLMKGDEKHAEKKSVGNFIIEGVIELFEVCLTYVTNTMSFLRIGGFVLSHAGLMLVFSVMSEMIGGVGGTVIMIFGNLFVTGMEGFLVGIQVLRLEFYELFSRFFKGGGKPFEAVSINSKAA